MWGCVCGGQFKYQKFGLEAVKLRILSGIQIERSVVQRRRVWVKATNLGVISIEMALAAKTLE